MILRIPGTQQWKQELTLYADVLQEYKHRRDNLYHYKAQEEEELSALRSIATAGSFNLPRSSWHIFSLTFLGQFFDKAGNYFVKRYNLGATPPATRQQKVLSTSFYLFLYLPVYYYSLYSAYTLSQESFVRKDLETGFKKIVSIPTPLGKEFESIIRLMDTRHIILQSTRVGMDYEGDSPERRIATAANLQLKNQWHKAQLTAAAKSRINKSLPQVDYDVIYVQQALSRLPWYATHHSTTNGTTDGNSDSTTNGTTDDESTTVPMSSSYDHSSSISLSSTNSPMYEAAYHQDQQYASSGGSGRSKDGGDRSAEGMELGSVFTTIFGGSKRDDGGKKEWNNNNKGEQLYGEVGRGGSRVKRRREKKRHHHHHKEKEDREEVVTENGRRSRSSARLISV